MFRKRRRPTPHFKIPSPYNPIQGENANLRQDGVSPFCAMMQVAAEDTYDEYVICRGFDPRILRFITYAEGDADKPGISVAKPFGKRRPGTYQIGEVYPAFLPTQGNADFTDFRQVTYIPPSPADVNWRVGQNPGVVDGGGLPGGQPEDLGDTIEILRDHNDKVVNWLLIDSKGDGGGMIQGPVFSAAGGEVTIFVQGAPTHRPDLLGTIVPVIDLSGCIFDLEDADLEGVWVWAEEQVHAPNSIDWCAVNRCCAENEA